MAVTEEQLAAAIMAKIAGGNLKKIDDSSLSPVTPGMNANRIDPMSFVKNVSAPTGPTPQQIQMMEQANREAERLYPLPQADLTPIPQMPSAAPAPGPANITYSTPSPQAAPVTLSDSVITREDIASIRSQLERTNATLTKMSGMLGKVFASFTEKSKLKDSD
jgi:hypothetical protein